MSDKNYEDFFIFFQFLISENLQKFEEININNENLVRKIFNYIIEKQTLEEFNNSIDDNKIERIQKIIKQIESEELELEEMVEDIMKHKDILGRKNKEEESSMSCNICCDDYTKVARKIISQVT